MNMTVHDELGELMRVRSNMDHVAMGEEPTAPHDEQAWQDHAARFLRDHGLALLAIVGDAERYRFLKAHKIIGGPNPDEWIDENMGLDRQGKDVIKAIDQARAGK